MIKSPRTNRQNRKGFTLIELLVVVLILATLMAVALPLYVSSVRDASLKTCRANMQSIANAAQAWKVRTRAADFSGLVSDLTQLNGDLGAMPKTPGGLTYSLSVTTTGNVSDGVNAAAGQAVAGDLVVFSNSSGTATGNECGGFIPGKMSN